jgi:hypothetical protein
MKTVLKISVLLNAILLGGLVFLWPHPQKSGVTTPLIAPMAQSSALPIVHTVMEPAPFRWSQLVSTNDYRLFVANLRASGCPESTVESIVRGDTEQVFSTMRQRSGAGAMDNGRWSEQSQNQMVAYLLGQAPTEEQGIIAEKPVANGQNNRPADNLPSTAVAMAAFIQNFDLNTPGMTPEQAQETANVRASFLAQVSAVNTAVNNQAIQPASQAGADSSSSSQDGTDGTQVSGTGGRRPLWHMTDPALLQAEEAESVLGGLFGSGAAGQYDQYNNFAQSSQ